MKKWLTLLAAVVLMAGLMSCDKLGGSAPEALTGTTWITTDSFAYSLKLSFSDSTANLIRDGYGEGCTFPYTYSEGEVNTKFRISFWNDGQPFEVTGRVSNLSMTFTIGGAKIVFIR